MENAYDLKELGARLKVVGLDAAEDALKAAVPVLSQWLKESAALSATPWDDMALVVWPQVEKLLLEKADKVDGKEG